MFRHAVVGFGRVDDGRRSFLDLSSMQFGNVGRGLGTTFALDTGQRFQARMHQVVEDDVVDGLTKISKMLAPQRHPHPFEAQMAAVARERRSLVEVGGAL